MSELEATNAALTAENTALKARVAALEAETTELKATIAKLQGGQSAGASKMPEPSSKPETQPSAPAPAPTVATPAAAKRARVAAAKKITSYGWDQARGSIKLYVSHPGVRGFGADAVTSSLSSSGDVVTVEVAPRPGGTVHRLVVELAKKCTSVTHKLSKSSDRVIVTIKKAEEQTWSVLTAAEQTAADARAPKADPSADADSDPMGGLMKMMGDMYQNGDDDMKRMIAKAWTEGQEKKGLSGGGLA